MPVTCRTGLAHDGHAFVVEGLPSGAIYDAATATVTWTPALDQGANYQLTVTSTPHDEAGVIDIGVLDRFDDPDNVPPVDPTTYRYEYDLPVLHLEPSPDINSDAHLPATITFLGHRYAAEAKLRGAFSLNFPKNSYTLKYTSIDPLMAPDHGGGFVGKRKMVLTSTFDDNSYVRQRMAYEMWNELDEEHIQIQIFSGVVFIDGEYWGLYTFGDHVDAHLMQAHGLWKDGNLFKARTHDANFREEAHEGGQKQTLHDGLTKEEGFPIQGQPGDFDDLDELVDFVANAPSDTFLDEIDQRIDRRDYENWWIFVTLIQAHDSAGKNSYHYHDPSGSSGPWRYVPWDFNESCGQTWLTLRDGFELDPEEYVWANELFQRFLDEPSIGVPMKARYAEALQSVYQVDRILEKFDAMAAEVHMSALRDEQRWRQEYRSFDRWNPRNDFLDHEGEIAYVRAWIENRWAYAEGLY
ncbi:MAG: hypothetical protein GY946_13065 [bacterium]|nr:hypothetical protein [bacterium]